MTGFQLVVPGKITVACDFPVHFAKNHDGTYGYDPRGFFGDRYGAGERWVDLLAKQTGHECINAGANGREIPRNPYALRLLTEHAPVDVFLVMLGTNDLLQGASAKEAAT